jgi:hypothetical protein
MRANADRLRDATAVDAVYGHAVAAHVPPQQWLASAEHSES